MRCSPLLVALLVACGGTPVSDAGTDAPVARPDAPVLDWPLTEVPSTSELEDGVVREILVIPASDAPPNPVSGQDTPSELDAIQIGRYHRTPDAPPRAIILAMPGFLGGAGSFDRLARELVRLAPAAISPLEVWTIDRRANLLEDLRGMDAAEATGNVDIAKGYYFGRDTIAGEPFPGYVAQDDVSFMSEWGLSTHVNDVRFLIERIPEADRVEHVFLMGHSLGGSFAETFASWRFEDGTRGADMLAGVILVDGAAGTTPAEETAYLEGTSGGIMPSPGLNGVRDGANFVALPLLGIGVYATAEILSLEALTAPDAVVDDREREGALEILLGLPRVPAMTNEAALGWGFDDASNGLSFAAVSCGAGVGGATETYDSVLGATLLHPSDPAATYTWLDASESDPVEQTPIASLATSWTLGRTNFAEWYFPQRLPLDLSAVAGLAVAEDGWQAALGLRAFDGAAMDAPVLAIAAGLVDVSGYDASRARGAPIGAGRPNAGALRTDDAGYRVVDATFMTHIDPLTAPDTEANPVPDAILAFVEDNVGEGTTFPTLP